MEAAENKAAMRRIMEHVINEKNLDADYEVAVRLTYSGTDAATGERATWPEMVITRFSAGKAVESWEIIDTGRG